MPTDAPLSFRAALFDLDGTLVDSFEAIRSSVNAVRQRHNLAPIDLPTVSAFVGNGLHHLLANTAPAGDLLENSQFYLEHHPSVIGTHTRLLPGVLDTLAALHGRGVALGICSNKPLPLTTRLLAEMKIDGMFAVVLGPESVAKRKPAPDMLLRAIALLGIDKDEVVYVGDMTVDIETARAAGVRCWAIATGTQSADQLAAVGPDRLLARMDALLDPPRAHGRATSEAPTT